ncbi:MAG: Asp-tRNA(Asn)/Glu-tRNA(Gln) amidotransferase subunit GatC [Candidatus Omnitrophica bacterium]|nr:Asp-tRNA(Asn)/Glu-tRNA(Gln) amidotransferase subunit GatC [Candidatus Omnitrophota bacterium]
MPISTEDIRYVAFLARITFAPEELKRFATQLETILEYIEQLEELDVSDVRPTTHVLPVKNVLRKDEKRESLSSEAVMKNAPSKQNAFFKVPRIIQDK